MVKLLDPLDEKNRLDRYELIGEIAAGGMAVVYLARNAGVGGFQRFVAIKRLHPHLAQEQEFVEMFLDEARLAAGIHNPHVVPILEVGESDAGGYYLVMEYIEGDTLARVAARAAGRSTGLHPTAMGGGGGGVPAVGSTAGPKRPKNAPASMPSVGPAVPRAVTVRVLLDCLAGLHAAHELTDPHGRPLQIVHRDVSPQNLLVGVDGSARITDFGVARAAARLTTTRSDTVKGKLAYLSPEQARGETADRRTDLFAMGIILWEMLTGRRLFRGETDHETLARVLSGNIPPPSSLVPGMHPAFDAVSLRALDRNIEKRFASCSDMADALERAALDAEKAGAEGGVASPRDVAAFMNHVLGQEIAAQRESVRVWLSQRNDPSLAASRPVTVRHTLTSGAPAIVAPLPAPPRPLGLTPSLTPQPFASGASAPHPEDGDPTTLRVVSGLIEGKSARDSGSDLPPFRRSKGRVAAVVGVAALLAVGVVVLVKSGETPQGSPVAASSGPSPSAEAGPLPSASVPAAAASATEAPSATPSASAAPSADPSASADATSDPLKPRGKWHGPTSKATASAAASSAPKPPPTKPPGDDLSNPYK
jgi:serine/threonine protein kinase